MLFRSIRRMDTSKSTRALCCWLMVSRLWLILDMSVSPMMVKPTMREIINAEPAAMTTLELAKNVVIRRDILKAHEKTAEPTSESESERLGFPVGDSYGVLKNISDGMEFARFFHSSPPLMRFTVSPDSISKI